MPAMIRCTILFRGDVQGVGFRYTTLQVAGDHDVTGWVRNEPDRTVRCIVEGETGAIDSFLASVRDQMVDHISDLEIETTTATGEFPGFEIRS